MAQDQVIVPGRAGLGDGKHFRRWIGAVFGGVATVVGLVAGGIAIVEFLQRDGAPEVFNQSLDSADGMQAFLRFANKQDGKVVRLETQCVYNDGPRTCVDQADSLDRAVVLLDLNDDASCAPDREMPCDGSVVLFFFADDVSEAQIDNGQYGAGSIVVRGYFTLSKRGNIGTLPPGATAIYLTAVPAQDVPKD